MERGAEGRAGGSRDKAFRDEIDIQTIKLGGAVVLPEEEEDGK